MNRLRGAIAVTFVLVVSVALPLTVVKGTQFAWRYTLVALWAIAVLLALAWLATSSPVRNRVPFRVVRVDSVAPAPAFPASRRGTEAQRQAVALREALDGFVEEILKDLRIVDNNYGDIPHGEPLKAMREEYQVARRRLSSAYYPLKELFVEFIRSDSANDLRQIWGDDDHEQPPDYPITWWWKPVTFDDAWEQFKVFDALSMQRNQETLHSVLGAFEDWVSRT
jgi:hypothetical protein